MCELLTQSHPSIRAPLRLLSYHGRISSFNSNIIQTIWFSLCYAVDSDHNGDIDGAAQSDSVRPGCCAEWFHGEQWTAGEPSAELHIAWKWKAWESEAPLKARSLNTIPRMHRHKGHLSLALSFAPSLSLTNRHTHTATHTGTGIRMGIMKA